MVKDPVLTTFAFGRSSGIVLDTGHRQTVVSPVIDGYVVPKGIVKHDYGGQHLTNDLFDFLTRKKEL